MEQNPYLAPALAAEPLQFSIGCECGATVRVMAADAGGLATCRCGRVLPVPRLSQLRTAQGLAAYDTNIRDTIVRLIAEHRLPAGSCCAVTGMLTDDVMWFDVHCETTHAKGSRKAGIVALFLLALISWPLALLMRSLGLGAPRETERLGREIVVTVPLKVAADSRSKLRRRATQGQLRRTLITIPEYQQLLHEYPAARVYLR